MICDLANSLHLSRAESHDASRKFVFAVSSEIGLKQFAPGGYGAQKDVPLFTLSGCNIPTMAIMAVTH